MENSFRYFPLLKAKEGEFLGLAQLSKVIKRKLTPFVDVPYFDCDQQENFSEGEGNQESFENLHIDSSHTMLMEKHYKVIKNIRRSWGINFPVMMDYLYANEGGGALNQSEFFESVFDLIKRSLIMVIPTTGLFRGAEYNEVIAKFISKERRGVCVRILKEDVGSIDDLILGINELLKLLSVSRVDVDLLFDFGSIEGNDVDILKTLAVETINSFPGIREFRSLIITASNFPNNLLKIEPYGIKEFERNEYVLWKKLVNQSSRLVRIPSYGDYGIIHPDFKENWHKKFTPGGKLRYTLKDKFVVIRGKKFKRGSKAQDQYRRLTKTLIGRTDYLGSNFSWGDLQYSQCAMGVLSNGGLGHWIGADTNHHLTYVVNQLSSFSAP